MNFQPFEISNFVTYDQLFSEKFHIRSSSREIKNLGFRKTAISERSLVSGISFLLPKNRFLFCFDNLKETHVDCFEKNKISFFPENFNRQKKRRKIRKCVKIYCEMKNTCGIFAKWKVSAGKVKILLGFFFSIKKFSRIFFGARKGENFLFNVEKFHGKLVPSEKNFAVYFSLNFFWIFRTDTFSTFLVFYRIEFKAEIQKAF